MYNEYGKALVDVAHTHTHIHTHTHTELRERERRYLYVQSSKRNVPEGTELNRSAGNQNIRKTPFHNLFLSFARAQILLIRATSVFNTNFNNPCRDSAVFRAREDAVN